MSGPANIHGVALVLAGKGVLILGPSGAGKTTLALALLAHMQACGRFARLVADDRVLLATGGGRLVAAVPETIAGLAEAYGAGPASLPFLSRAVIDLAVELVLPEDAVRFGEHVVELLPGHALPLLSLAARSAGAAIHPVLASLGLPPFCPTVAPGRPDSGESPQIGACQRVCR